MIHTWPVIVYLILVLYCYTRNVKECTISNFVTTIIGLTILYFGNYFGPIGIYHEPNFWIILFVFIFELISIIYIPFAPKEDLIILTINTSTRFFLFYAGNLFAVIEYPCLF